MGTDSSKEYVNLHRQDSTRVYDPKLEEVLCWKCDYYEISEFPHIMVDYGFGLGEKCLCSECYYGI